MQQAITVEQCKPEYQPQILNLILQIQQEEYNIAITQADQPDLLDIAQFYQNGVGNFWVALHTGQVVGTIALLDIQNGQLALRKMFVAKEYRGQTYKTAHLLLSNALNWAEKNGTREIYLGTTPQYLAAHRFYEKNGFEEIPPEDLPDRFPIMAVDKKFYRRAI